MSMLKLCPYFTLELARDRTTLTALGICPVQQGNQFSIPLKLFPQNTINVAGKVAQWSECLPIIYRALNVV